MKYLVDTCVVSELVKKVPDQKVLDWMNGTPSTDLYLSAITIGEIQKGIERLDVNDSRRLSLTSWFSSVRRLYSPRILPFDEAVAITWGRIVGAALRIGRTRALLDSQIAATAVHHGLTLLTRNVHDMEGLGVLLVNPFIDARP